MEFDTYTNTGLVEALILVSQNRKAYGTENFDKIKKELDRRLGAYAVNVEHFSKFGQISEMTKTIDDFIREARQNR